MSVFPFWSRILSRNLYCLPSVVMSFQTLPWLFISLRSECAGLRSVGRPFIWVHLMFAHDQTQAVHSQQAHLRDGAVFVPLCLTPDNTCPTTGHVNCHYLMLGTLFIYYLSASYNRNHHPLLCNTTRLWHNRLGSPVFQMVVLEQELLQIRIWHKDLAYCKVPDW